MVPNFLRSSLWSQHDAILLTRRILKWLLDFWKICVYTHTHTHAQTHGATAQWGQRTRVFRISESYLQTWGRTHSTRHQPTARHLHTRWNTKTVNGKHTFHVLNRNQTQDVRVSKPWIARALWSNSLIRRPKLLNVSSFRPSRQTATAIDTKSITVIITYSAKHTDRFYNLDNKSVRFPVLISANSAGILLQDGRCTKNFLLSWLRISPPMYKRRGSTVLKDVRYRALYLTSSIKAVTLQPKKLDKDAPFQTKNVHKKEESYGPVILEYRR